MKIQPIPDCVLPGTEPMALYQTSIDRVVAIFEDRGWSSHSPQGAMMWAIIAYCRANGIGYRVFKHNSGNGYGIAKAEAFDSESVLASLGFNEVKGF